MQGKIGDDYTQLKVSIIDTISLYSCKIFCVFKKLKKKKKKKNMSSYISPQNKYI